MAALMMLQGVASSLEQKGHRDLADAVAKIVIDAAKEQVK